MGDHEDGRPRKAETAEANILRGNRAIRWALQHKADVHNAMHHPTLGWIDFPWHVQQGWKGIGGVQHILESRIVRRQSIEHVLASIPQAIERGTVSKPYGHPWPRVEITYKGHGVVIRLDRDGADGRWLLTGYELTKGGSR